MFQSVPRTRGRTRRIPGVFSFALPLPLLLMLCGCSASTQTTSGPVTTPDVITARSNAIIRDATAIAVVQPGTAIPDLSSNEQIRFAEGKALFETPEDPDEGLGPVFNGKSCVECHIAGATGGAAFDTNVSVVTRFGGLINGVYSDLETLGGPVIQRRSIHEIDPSNPAQPEVVPPEATFVSQRTTTPLFGAGLIEAIPASTLESFADPNDRDRDGISGRVNHVYNPETKQTEIGRFGWKAQVSSLTVFAADAYLNEMGITTPLFPDDLLPQGKAVPGADLVADAEDDGADIPVFADFMRFLAPPTPVDNDTNERGRVVFRKVGCVSCHVPELATGNNATAALTKRRVALFSDLLVHDLGDGLADGIRQGEATGSEFRTAPLWGIRLRKFLLHDGRAKNVREAIGWHGGEASTVIAASARLSRQESDDLFRFVESR